MGPSLEFENDESRVANMQRVLLLLCRGGV